MLPCSVWHGIDRQSFFENTILLSDEKYRSQGRPLKVKSEQLDAKSTPADEVGRLLQMTPVFLNDFALIASGRGGPDNVTATCLEVSDDGYTHTLRVARNGGDSNGALEAMNDIIAVAEEGASTGATTF